MINIQGQLAIRTITGRNGNFNVGRLITSIGEFVVKDATLDQYDEGKYDGQFVVTEIKPSCYTHGGRLVMEVRARLGGMTLDDLDKLTEEESDDLDNREPDPILEEVAKQPAAAAPTPPVPQPKAEHAAKDMTPFGVAKPSGKVPAESTSADAELFGAIWPLGDVVKIDPTEDRQTIRDQRQRLSELGYTLNFRSQQWTRKGAESQ